jgi:acyl-CoA synthetase (NDP forming)/GNAT superfamily N-acetyltransferase
MATTTSAPPIEAVLRDGSVVELHGSQARDADGLRALYERLPRDDVRMRFFSPTADVGRMLGRMLDPANVNVVAVAGPVLLAHGMYAPLGDARAEVAFTVAPEAQGRGIGTLLLRHLADLAHADGIDRFVAEVLPGNHRMIDMFRQSGFPATVSSRAGTIAVELPTAPTPEALERYGRRERIAAVTGVAHVLRPSGVVVVGASRRRGTVSGELVHNLLAGGYTGALHLVNDRASQVQGRPAYRSVADVPDPVELAVLAVPARDVVEVARACAARGVRALVVLAAGFAETGAEGAQRQRELLDVCRAAGMRLVGPNCMGIRTTDPAVRLDATFAPQPPWPGRLGLLTQSGGLGLAALGEAERRGIGLSAFLSVGNRADVSANDLLEWWEQDERTHAVLLYLESFGNPRRFARIARRVARTTPIVAVKAGRSAAGARAAASHTGRLLAASDSTVDALMHHAGVIRVDTLDELLDTGALLAGLPAPAGPRVAIVGNAGGLGIMALDACEAGGLQVPELSQGLRGAIAAARPGAATGNPVDLIAHADAEDYRAVLPRIATSGEVDAIVAIHVRPMANMGEGIPAVLARMSADAPGDVPIVPVIIGARIPDDAPVAFAAPEPAARALARAWRHRAWRDAAQDPLPPPEGIRDAEAAAILARALAAGGGWLGPEDVAALLSCYGIATPPQEVAKTAAAAARAASRLGPAVAVKAVAPTLVHKGAAGAVRIGVRSGAGARRATSEVLRAAREAGHEPTGVLVQAMAGTGAELLAGVVHDPSFGPVVACGPGGSLVEVVAAVEVRLAPLAAPDVEALAGAPATAQLLAHADANAAAVGDALVRLAALADAHPRIAELELNPLLASADGVVAVDARVRVAVG